MADYLEVVANLAEQMLVQEADAVDRRGVFPDRAIEALGNAGLLGLISSPDVGGMGLGAREAAFAVERLARHCGTTAMVACMHFAGTAVIEMYGPIEVRRDIAAGRHLSTLAFAEPGTRSLIWEPISSAQRVPGGVALEARKNGVISARHAHAFIWSSRPLEATSGSTLWLVPRETPGVQPLDTLEGLGLRGGDSTPVIAEGAVIPEAARLGKDGEGVLIMRNTVLPMFNLMSAGCSLGLMDGALKRAIAHVSGTRYQNSDACLSELPVVRAHVARMRISVDQVRMLWLDAIAAVEQGREDAFLRVLQCRAAASESANEVLDAALRVCGGAAFRREIGIERAFRDARAAGLLTPTTDQLNDAIGKVVCGLPVM